MKKLVVAIGIVGLLLAFLQMPLVYVPVFNVVRLEIEDGTKAEPLTPRQEAAVKAALEKGEQFYDQQLAARYGAASRLSLVAVSAACVIVGLFGKRLQGT